MPESFFDFREKMMRDAAPPASAKNPSAKNPADAISVSELTHQIERALKDKFPKSILVRGEVSNYNPHRSGHVYFTLKDADACIDCVMFRSDAERMKFQPQDGIELLANGKVAVYGIRGKYQLYISTLHPIGHGALELAFQQLRKKLETEGLFAAERKKLLPVYPLRIALITSSGAAALQDMLKVLRKFPWLRLMVYPVPVQGSEAAPKIAAALRHLSQHQHDIGGIDVILLGRGGGSLEDLWAFNDEAVARAVAASNIPIVTGIGHEVDVSIADLIADYHAHTPTEAAQVITAKWRGVDELIIAMHRRIDRGFDTMLRHLRQRLLAAERHELFRRPLDGINRLRQHIDDRDRGLRAAIIRELLDHRRKLANLETRLAARHPRHQLKLSGQRLASQSDRLSAAMLNATQHRRARINAIDQTLRALSPQAVLQRGYSMTTLKKGGAIVRSTAQIRPGDKLLTRLADGNVQSTADDLNQPRLFE